MVTAAVAALAANDPPRGFGPGFIGFAVLFLMAVATYLLFRSMVGHLRKVRYSPDPAATDVTTAETREEPPAR
ncbi:MAG: hypothetical protein IPJ14_08895 [Kineosporiaceae bacterium]|nr:hypothetical protein [Kineosporiaceae bacterium]MBK7622768.1 hypothetical protein [Kineosporiaceae bacterium]MBK8078744.1 hypothetical protein [Kineosporiaceae bacterium]